LASAAHVEREDARGGGGAADRAEGRRRVPAARVVRGVQRRAERAVDLEPDGVGEGDGAAVKGVGGADDLRDLGEAAEAVIEPDALALVARQAAAAHRRPVLRVGDDRAVADGDGREVVPVAAALAGRHVAVHEVQIESAVVVQIAELCSPAPASELDAEAGRQVLVRARPF